MGIVKEWLKVLTGPLAWFASLCGSFAIEPWACSVRSKAVLFAFPLAALAITLFSGTMAWVHWRETGREFPGEASAPVGRSRAMASGGVLLNGFFVLVLLAQILVPGFLGACE